MNAAQNRKRALGLTLDPANDPQVPARDPARHAQIEFVLSALGLLEDANADSQAFPPALLESYREQSRLLRDYRCPVDKRIEAFLIEHFRDIPGGLLRLPGHTLILPEHGIAREVSLPADRDD